MAISDEILNKNGIIISTRYNYISHKLEHIVCKTPKERDACRGSKYFQSYIDGSIYLILESELAKGTPILFIGTPCQVAAINQYVIVKKLRHDSLITCDILCHGVGSPGIWAKFLKWKNKKINYITFNHI